MARTVYRTADVDNKSIFYREAGSKDAPVLLLLHGFPSSSHMFRDLIPALADAYRVIAPDLPGFGFSDTPGRAEFNYTFQNLTDVIDRFTETLGLDHYAVYMLADPLIRRCFLNWTKSINFWHKTAIIVR